MERKRILVLYGDILNFSDWLIRPTTSPENVDQVMGSVYKKFEDFSFQIGGMTKFVGDAILTTKEISDKPKQSLVLDFIRQSYDFAHLVDSQIKSFWPRPEGFRVRLAEGYVFKANIKEPSKTGHRHLTEYLGYPINLSWRILSVEPKSICILHESIVRLLGKNKDGLLLDKVKNLTVVPHGVDPNDLNGLSFFSFKNT